MNRLLGRQLFVFFCVLAVETFLSWALVSAVVERGSLGRASTSVFFSLFGCYCCLSTPRLVIKRPRIVSILMSPTPSPLRYIDTFLKRQQAKYNWFYYIAKLNVGFNFKQIQSVSTHSSGQFWQVSFSSLSTRFDVIQQIGASWMDIRPK